MFEYRYSDLTEKTLEMLAEQGIYPIEEDFKRESRSFVVYGGESFADILPGYLSKIPVEDTGWEDKWKEFIIPGMLTDTLAYDFDTAREPSDDVIIINPSMAFGTGTHPTTRCAAKLLESICRDKTVLDVGCGSGILAIAASKKGASKVWAFDTDPVALVNVSENVRLNRVDNVAAWAGGIDSFSGRADVIAANIITGVLNIIHPYVIDIKPEYIVYSGILEDEFEEFVKGLSLEGYVQIAANRIDEWRGVVFRCR